MTDPSQRRDIWWWYWAVTFVFIAAALLGWAPGYGLVMLISTFQLGHSILKNGAISAFPVQVRIVYLAVTLFGFWDGPRFWVFALLLIGTFMVVFMGRCGIALALKPMPWNKGREIRMD